MAFSPAGTRLPDPTFCIAHAGDWVAESNKVMEEMRKQEEFKWESQQKKQGEGTTPVYLWLSYLHQGPPPAAPEAEQEMLQSFTMSSWWLEHSPGSNPSLAALSSVLRPLVKGFLPFTGQLNPQQELEPISCPSCRCPACWAVVCFFLSGAMSFKQSTHRHLGITKPQYYIEYLIAGVESFLLEGVNWSLFM